MTVFRYGFWKEARSIRLARNPDPSQPRWTRLCLPADYVNNQLVPWHQKNAKSLGNPWTTNGLNDSHIDGGVATLLVNSGTAKIYRSDFAYGYSTWLSGSIRSNMFSWSLDKTNKKFSFEFYLVNTLEETSPLVVADDGQAAFWVAQNCTVSDDTTTVKKGTDSLKIVTSAQQWGLYHTYTTLQDWSQYDFLCLWFYGANSGHTIFVKIVFVDTGEGNYEIFYFTDNFTGWRRFVLPLRNPDGSGGTVDLTQVKMIKIGDSTGATTATVYLDRLVLDVGQWVEVEAYVPDVFATVEGKVGLFAWDGANYNQFAYYGGGGGVYRYWIYTTTYSQMLRFLSSHSAYDVFGDTKGFAGYEEGYRGETKNRTGGDSDSGSTITYSSYYGCKKRIGFALKMPPDTLSSDLTGNGAINKVKLKLEVYYDQEGEVTYEFEDSLNQYYGLRNINQRYLCLFRHDQPVTDFLELIDLNVGSGLPSGLEVRANHDEEIVDVRVGFPNPQAGKVHWGESDADSTLDSDADGIPDNIEEVEDFVGGGGF